MSDPAFSGSSADGRAIAAARAVLVPFSHLHSQSQKKDLVFVAQLELTVQMLSWTHTVVRFSVPLLTDVQN